MSADGVGGIQPGLQNTGIQEQQPAKARFGLRKLLSFSPKKLFMASQSNSATQTKPARKTFQQYDIRTTRPTTYIRINAQGPSVTHIHTVQDAPTNRAFLKQQAAILVEKGYTSQEAQGMVKSFNKSSGQSQPGVETEVGKTPFRNKTKQQWAQWAEKSFLQKGYTPQEARKWSHNLLKEARTNFKDVEHTVRKTPMTPAVQIAFNAQQQAVRNQMKTADFQWGVNHFVRLGFSPKVAHESITNAQQHFGDNRNGFIDWIQKAPSARTQSQPTSGNNQPKEQFIEQKLKPWAMETLKTKGYSKEDAALLLDNLMKGANGNLDQVMAAVQRIAPVENENTGSTSATEVPLSQAETEASKAQDRKNLEILGLKEDATRSQAKKAFKRLSLKYHPDKTNTSETEAKFKEVEAAHKALEKSKTFDVLPPEIQAMKKKDNLALEALGGSSLSTEQDLQKRLDWFTQNHQNPEFPEDAISKERYDAAVSAFNYLTKESTTWKPETK